VHEDGSQQGPQRTRVAEKLREEIVNGRLEPGTRLIEEQLSTELETSRGPVREALRQLEQEGLVRSYPYRGAVVLGVTEEEVRELLIPIRLTLERFAFGKALPLLSDDDLAELGKQLWLMDDAAQQGDLAKLVEADIRFHEVVLSRAGRTHAVQLWRSIAPRIRGYFLRYGEYTDLDYIVGEHRDLLAAIRTRDPMIVMPALEAHIAVDAPEPEPASAASE
jgi:DNA-binding GntR family transcriptional regulator